MVGGWVELGLVRGECGRVGVEGLFGLSRTEFGNDLFVCAVRGIGGGFIYPFI